MAKWSQLPASKLIIHNYSTMPHTNGGLLLFFFPLPIGIFGSADMGMYVSGDMPYV
jgi:hypothetical protein